MLMSVKAVLAKQLYLQDKTIYTGSILEESDIVLLVHIIRQV